MASSESSDQSVEHPSGEHPSGARRSALISAEVLAAELAAGERPLLLDVRWTLQGADRDGYLEAHLPGAVFCDLDADLAAEPGEGGRHPLPSPEVLAATLHRLGVRPGQPVVAYDGGAGAAAARAWWCLRWAGHDEVRVLDGGFAAWLEAGGTTEAGAPTGAGARSEARVGGTSDPAPGDRERPSAPGARSTMPVVTVEDLLAGRAGALLDARSAERFRGEVEPVDPVAGHVPGATSCPTAALQGPDGRYLPPDRLRALLVPLVGEGAAAAYCGSGVTASQLVLAAHEVGIELALYPGSWSHWVRDPSRPVATGA
ncbi:sulfurtransferase [Actinotalea sp. BY-33]|uniref:Sulfurtransferase n=1 Tax=Actinotalea soli TaxID=2819234 RepID=A0A939RUL1_9CELL|nr:sulfurtransferase [Actinotalea soli]MBO1752784.1 sulfurtransferase [Actinotalea soli]